MSLSKREKACRELNRDLHREINKREYATENGIDVGSKISLPSTSKVPYSAFWGSVHFGIIEHCLVLDVKDNKSHTGDWMKEEKVSLTKPVSDLFTQDIVGLKKTQKSLQSPENTEANNRKWTQRAKMAGKEKKRFQAVKGGGIGQRVSKADRENVVLHTEHLHEANERTANDYRSYFR